MSPTYFCLCWTELFDNVTFHTEQVLHLQSYVVSLSAEWLSSQAGQQAVMWQVCAASDSRGEALAQDSWSTSQQRVKELRSWGMQRLAGEEHACTVLIAIEMNTWFPPAEVVHCLCFQDYLCKENKKKKKKENISDRGYGFTINPLCGSMAVWKCWRPTIPLGTG